MVAWPDPGTAWDGTSTPPRIGLEGTFASLGDVVTLSGGVVSEWQTSAFKWKRAPAEECDERLLWVADSLWVTP